MAFMEGLTLNKWVCFSAFMIIVVFAVYFLYRQGLVMSKSIKAILFAFRPTKFEDRATLDACSGWVRHIGRFQESRIYNFSLDAQLSHGNVEVFLLDAGKATLLRLNKQSPTGSIEIDGKNKYYLRYEFRDATGKCKVSW